MIQFNRFYAAPAVLAALSLTAMPATAAEIPVTSSRSVMASEHAWQPVVETAQNHRRWRGHRHWRHRGGTDVGGLLAGALLIGGIAAVASAATRDSRRAEYRAPPPPPPYYAVPYAAPNAAPYTAPDTNQRADYAGAAARVCINAIEHGARVDGGLTVDPRDFGFTVRGRLIDGPSFACDVARDGRIERIAYDGVADRQGYVAPPAQDQGMSEAQRAYRDSRLNGTEHEAAPAYPDVGTGDAAPGQGVDTRPEYPGDMPQDQAQDEAATPDSATRQGDGSDDGDLDPGRMQASPSSITTI